MKSLMNKMKSSLHNLIEQLEQSYAMHKTEVRQKIAEHKAELEQKIAEHKAELEQKDAEHKAELEQRDSVYNALQQKYELITTLLDISPDKNPGLLEFAEYFFNDFMDFANNEASLENEADAILELQSVQQELELVNCFYELINKRTLAIGGGFSAGKSAFINCLSQLDENMLPVGISKTTAVPTYVVHSEDIVIQGYGSAGGNQVIPPNLYKQINHGFIEALGFDLRKIMPYASIGMPLADGMLEHLCLIDTPGYNPSKSGYSGLDANTAHGFINQADAMIWCVLCKSGELPQSDIEFMNKLSMEDKPLFVLATKADLVPPRDCERILNQIANTMDIHGISYEGISAFSAHNKEEKEIMFMKKSVYDFIQEQNSDLAPEKWSTRNVSFSGLFKSTNKEKIHGKTKASNARTDHHEAA